MGSDFIQITQRLNGKGRSTSLDSALARPFRKFIQEGKPAGKINHVFYEDAGAKVILGSMCYSPGSRIIFFPGIIERKIAWESSVVKLAKRGPLDHITLEPDLQTWHITSITNGKKDKQRLPTRIVRSVEPALDYWFGMSVASPTVFEPEPEEFQFSFEVPHKNANKFADILFEARDGSIFHTLSPIDKRATASWEFLHFDFLIDRRKNRSPENFPPNTLWVPTGPPALKDRLDYGQGELRIPTRVHQVKLIGFDGDIAILVSRHRAELAERVILGGFTDMPLA